MNSHQKYLLIFNNQEAFFLLQRPFVHLQTLPPINVVTCVTETRISSSNLVSNSQAPEHKWTPIVSMVKRQVQLTLGPTSV